MLALAVAPLNDVSGQVAGVCSATMAGNMICRVAAIDMAYA